MINRIRQRIDIASGVWRQPLLYGVVTAAAFWCVWYFTKVPCSPDNAAMSLCNPGWLARFVNVEILALAVGAGIAAGGAKGGYDIYMLKNMINQEREARLKTERELQEVREIVAELRNELHEERQRAAEERRQDIEERRRYEAEERQRAAEERQQDIEERRRYEAEERQRAAEERQQDIEERRRYEAEERRLAAEERQRDIEERRQTLALQQAMLETIVRLAERRNGNGNRSSD